jgi:tetratricopeptide (TPR) repeat protein
MQARSIVLAALSFFLPILAAQTPKPAAALPAGDRIPVKNLPILAKPDLSGQEAVMEKMALVVRYAKDGSCVRTLTVREHVLSNAGVRDAGIVSIPFASSAETVTFDYVRVRKPSGELVETLAEDAQEMAAPVTESAPMYSDLRVKQLPIRSLSVDDTVEYQVTVHATDTDAPGQHSFVMDFMTGIPVQEQTIELRVPLDFVANIVVKSEHPTTTDEGSERVYRWKHETASEYPKKQEKDDSAPVQLVQAMYAPEIAMSGFRSWGEMGAWYRGLMKDRAVPDAAIQAKADDLTRGLTTDDAKVDAIYNYVATQYRYIAVSFGIGRLQPHTAAEVFRNRYGDCKDKHTLLQAMLAAEKIEAEPVLIHSSVRVNPGLPIPAQFDHMITLVKLKDHDVWLDSTPEVAPSRMLLAGLRDKLALAIPATGDAQLVRTEATLPFPSFVRETITGKLAKGGVLTAHFDLTLRGDAEVMYRALYHRVPRANWQELTQNISENTGFAGEVSAVDASLPEKTAEPFHVSWDYTRKDFGEWENLRFPQIATWFQGKFATGVTPPKRQIALDTTGETSLKVTLTLPEGYTVTVPADVKRAKPFAEYSSTYKLKDRTLEMEYALHYKVRELPLDAFQDYVGFVNGMSDDASQMIQLVGASAQEPKTTVKADNSQARELLQQSYQEIRSNDKKKARDLLDKVKSMNDQQSGLWAQYGALDWISNNKPQAVADYKKEVELHPENFGAYQWLIWFYTNQGQWPDAEQTMQAWAKAEPADPRPLAGLGALQVSQKKYKEAETSLREAITLSTEPDPLKLQLGQAQIKAGETAAGKATLHALMDTSDDPLILNDTAYELGDAGLDLPAAEAASRKAVGLQETRTTSTDLASVKNEDFQSVFGLAADWDTLGWIYFKQNKLPEAESYVRSAWLLLMNPEGGLHMGKIYEAEGKRDEALTAYRLAMKTMGQRKLTQSFADMKTEMETRAAALEKAGAHEVPGPHVQQVGDELAALRTYTIASPLDGQYASADFLLLLGDNRAEDVRFFKGDESLKKATPTLLSETYRSPLPTGSKAKVLRRGIVACTTGSKTCLLVMLPAAEARAD